MAAILVVDDEPLVGEAISQSLQHAGFEVALAESATAGLASITRAAPDVVVTDLIMPQVDGLAFIRGLRVSHPRVRIIAISGGGSLGPLGDKPEAISTAAFNAAALQAGADHVLMKPFDLEELLRAVRQLLPN